MKKFFKTVLHPKRPYGTILGVLFIVLSIAVLLLQLNESPVAYICYLLSAYGLYLLIADTAVPLVKKIKSQLRKNPYIDRYYTDTEFKMRVILYRGSALNIIYAVFKLITGIRYRSFWFIAIAIYYISLCVIKMILIKADIQMLKNKESALTREWNVYRTAGWLLFPLNISLSGIIFQVIWHGESYSYSGSIIFAMAFYAFYRIIVAFIRLFKDRKKQNPVFSAAKCLDLIFAIVAMFTLQTAMLSTFGGGDSYYTALFNSIGGIAASLFVTGAAIYMIIRASVKIKSIRNK